MQIHDNMVTDPGVFVQLCRRDHEEQYEIMKNERRKCQ